ncbi:PLDc N-terminal domain-containing protein [Methanolobus profundi]|uniref:Phospholipase_D-nuclease N-terminal n=1 Tax=Methanolobus profundi TaxID=487685 RepID=A0A1I4TV04_9EURY|nr:PLDc N-terminal domain-containing protein [Methanolobus profundi]SFM80552.1 Phospholipase_D-nuclease N-terminal [Methanolobus profundi]
MFDEILFGIIPFIIFLLFFGVGILGTLFWVWMLIDCATKEPSEGNDKLIWIIVIIFTHLLGALIYFLVRRPKRIEMHGK